MVTAAPGMVGAQVLAFLYGLGKNGKSVLLDSTVKLLGDYADRALACTGPNQTVPFPPAGRHLARRA